jgi:hypothetical protein
LKVRVRPEKAKQTPPKDLLIRFGFGAGISIVAGLISMAFGPRAGGMFLAFPAILPATLTLLQQEESKREAKEDDQGAILGAIGLLAFATTAALLLEGSSGWVALGTASGAWVVTSIGLYVAIYGRRS